MDLANGETQVKIPPARLLRWALGLGLVVAVSAGAGVWIVNYAYSEKFTNTRSAHVTRR
jgi:hypothetical protein